MFFKVKKGTAMRKIMQAFADRKGVALDVLRFTIDGARVNAEDTPKMLEMEDGDQIDVLLQQLACSKTKTVQIGSTCTGSWRMLVQDTVSKLSSGLRGYHSASRSLPGLVLSVPLAR
jgi:small ubiquitin-related modifier